MNPAKSQHGFTLAEVMVVSIIMAVLAGAFVTFLRIHNDSVNEGVALSKLRHQAEIVSAEIARKTRIANVAMASDEAWSSGPTLSARDVGEIVIYDDGGNLTGAFSVDGTVLYEDPNGSGIQPFLVAGDTVLVDSNSTFGLSPDRREVALNLKLWLVYRDKYYEAAAKGGMYQCRN